jgi:hypothetical protein
MLLPDFKAVARWFKPKQALVPVVQAPAPYSWDIAEIARLSNLPEIETLYNAGQLGEVVLFEKRQGDRIIKIVFENWPESEPFQISTHKNIEVAGPIMARPTKMFRYTGLCLTVQCHMPGHPIADDFVAVGYSYMKDPSDEATRVRFGGYFGSPVLSDPESLNIFNRGYLHFTPFEGYFAFLKNRDTWLSTVTQTPLPQNRLQISA